MKSSKDIFVGLDFFKLIAAFLVVMAHTGLGAEFGPRIGSFVYIIIPVAVPFFFCCSGFFLSRNQKDSFPWKQLKRLLIFNCIWTIIYLPFTWHNLNNIKDFFLYFFIYGTFYHLWYIPSLFIGIILVSLIRNVKALMIIGIPVFLLGVLGSGYYEIGMKIPYINNIIADFSFFDKLRRIFCFGFVFTALGYVIQKKMNILQPLIKTRTAQFLISAVILYLVEVAFLVYFDLDRDTFITLLLVPLVGIFFFRGLFLPLKNSENLKKRGYMCRSIANCIYFVHPLIIMLLSSVIKYPTLLCFFTFLISGFVGYLIVKINNPYLNRLIQ